MFWGNVGRKVLQFSCTGAPQITKYSFFVELRESQCLATTRVCLESFEAGTILFMWSVKTCLLKNNEIIVERSELPFPQHLSHFNSEFILGYLLCPYAIKLSCFQEHAWPKCNNVEKLLLFQKATRPPTRVELCTVRGSAKFFPCTQWTHLYHFVPTGTHLDTARMQKCQTCPHVEWSVHHVFLVSKKQFSCTYYLPRCLAIEVANIVMSSIYIPLIQMSKATNKSSGLFCCDDNRGVTPENYILV